MKKRRSSPWQGSIVEVKRKGVVIAYQARVPYEDALGVTRHRSINARTRREADRARARLVLERDAGRGIVRPERRTVADEAHHWLETVKRGKIKNTSLDTYRQKMERYVYPYIGHIELTALRRHHCETWQRKLLDAGLSHAMINSVTDMVVHMCERLVPDVLSSNVARIERLPKKPSDRTALTPEQVDLVIAAYPRAWFRRFLTILFWTGLRSGELAALRLPDVLEDHPVLPHIRVVGTRYQLGHERGVHTPKTAAGERIVPLLPPAAQALREMRADHIAQLRAFGMSWNPEQFVFLTGLTERPYGHSQLYMAWRSALNAAGLPVLPLHTTRHTTATLLLAADVPARIQTAILGHVSLEQTHDYQHPDFEMLAASMKRVTQYLEQRQPDKKHGT